jgi:cell division septation protein DedD
MNGRVRPREKYELSLDGRQVASIVVGALVILAVVFVLGLNVGKQVALRQLEPRRAGDLDALDRAPAAPPIKPAPPAKPEPLTFHDRLTKEAPPPPPPPDAAAAASPGPPAAASPPPAAPPTAPPEAPPPAADPPAKPWTVQLAASSDRAEAERLASRFATLRPRVEEAVVPGKGLFFRVRVGGFETKDEAQRYLRDLARETGAKGIVVPAR